MIGWEERPTCIENWEEDFDYIVFLDENGSPDLKHVKKQVKENRPIDESNKYFTLTGCIMERSAFPESRRYILQIKYKYWHNGVFYYEKWKEHRRVCFHSREIRRQSGPFCKEVILWNKFIDDLTGYMLSCVITIISVTIDKEVLVKKHGDRSWHPYEICLSFLLERVSKFYLKHDKNAVLILEGRGKKEDKYLLKHMVKMFKNGTNFVGPEYFKNIIGVYFNTKWCSKSNNQKSYLGLEIADLCSHPIHRYVISNKKNQAFEVIEEKIDCYPWYWGKGLKIFP
ncbi:MAG: DUF3800 domain-containing protein [Desulfitobacteriaceae bacterium]|jgi:hypothetical protein|nr:DUF3800 domain-containing protein [Desulfitobacteriaceae bacterium]MDD4753714.1 DUF3800 domain-containing protein [Desulfitobacteriaceae bacterium]